MDFLLVKTLLVIIAEILKIEPTWCKDFLNMFISFIVCIVILFINIKKICAPSWLYLQDYARMHGQQNIKFG